ncbi:hypothetical protein WDW37_07225 [Bdellovibrionota bacterium FG-1]
MVTSLEEFFGKFFKSEVMASGLKLYAQGKVSVPGASDTAIQGYVRTSPLVRVHLSAAEIDSESFVAECSCPLAKKSQFCKHVWATLVCVEKKYPDFLSAKRNIEKPDPASGVRSEAVNARQASAKLKAAEYRKDQYQKQKSRAKERKRESRGGEKSVSVSSFPPEIERALVYFSDNGFPMPLGPDKAIVNEAKKKLSRVFHPDKGGSNEEIVALNLNCEVLLLFLQD